MKILWPNDISVLSKPSLIIFVKEMFWLKAHARLWRNNCIFGGLNIISSVKGSSPDHGMSEWWLVVGGGWGQWTVNFQNWIFLYINGGGMSVGNFFW